MTCIKINFSGHYRNFVTLFRAENIMNKKKKKSQITAQELFILMIDKIIKKKIVKKASEVYLTC